MLNRLLARFRGDRSLDLDGPFDAEMDQAISLLRETRFDENELRTKPHHVTTITRKVRVSVSRHQVTYWAPAFVGAGLAAVALVVILQSLSSDLQPVGVKAQEARLSTTPQTSITVPMTSRSN